jgi:hypothetical protein
MNFIKIIEFIILLKIKIIFFYFIPGKKNDVLNEFKRYGFKWL